MRTSRSSPRFDAITRPKKTSTTNLLALWGRGQKTSSPSVRHANLVFEQSYYSSPGAIVGDGPAVRGRVIATHRQSDRRTSFFPAIASFRIHRESTRIVPSVRPKLLESE